MVSVRFAPFVRLMAVSVVIIGVLCSRALAQGVGSVQGVIKNESGKALTNARVIATKIGSNAEGILLKTDDKGAFALKDVPAGDYKVCVDDDDNKHLNPCQWATGILVTVAAGKTATASFVPAVASATLQVRVEDPRHLSDPKAGANETLVAVILPNGRLAPMNLVESDESGKTFQLAVPPGAHRVFVKSNYFRISNGKGEDLDQKPGKDGKEPAPTVDAPVSVTSGTSYIAVTITGKR